MSHTATTKTQIRNAAILLQTCEEMQLPRPNLGTHELYDRTKRYGYAVRMPGWDYPAIVNCDTGEVAFDNYNERWGKEIEFDRLVQRYTRNVLASTAQEQGFSDITEQVTEDGTIELTCASYA